MLGLVLLPVVALMAYQPEWRPTLRVAGLLLTGSMLGYRWVRGMLIGVGEGVSPRHVFLYLCTAEMLPVALAVHAALR
jgi:hypothetical protein